MNKALVQWLFKKQTTDIMSIFDAEVVAMNHRMETLQGLRYKLRIMGVPVSRLSYIYGYNMSVIHNNQCPESTLKENINSTFYHTMRESVSVGGLLMTHVQKNDNPLNLMMKVLSGQKRLNFVDNILYDIYDEHQNN